MADSILYSGSYVVHSIRVEIVTYVKIKIWFMLKMLYKLFKFFKCFLGIQKFEYIPTTVYGKGNLAAENTSVPGSRNV